MKMNAQWRGMKELRQAVKRNPAKVKSEVNDFLVEGIAEYNRGVLRSPWRIGGSGGGAPVATGNLRDTHIREVKEFEASIRPDLQKAKYAGYVHEGTKKMQSRPWLDFVQESKSAKIKKLYTQMLDNIVNDLAK